LPAFLTSTLLAPLNRFKLLAQVHPISTYNQEKLFMTNKIKIAHKLLKKEKYYLDPNIIDKISWNIAFIKNDILENAFPHTRDDIIFLSSLDLNQTNEYMIETLIHEFIHIYQRK